MATFAQVVSRVRSLLEVTEASVPTLTISGWIGRAVGDISDIAERLPSLWDTLKTLQRTVESEVSTAHRLEWPTNAVRVLGTGTVWGQSFGALVRDSELPRPDLYKRPTGTSPWLVIGTDATGQYLEVLPHIFATKIAKLHYIKRPEETDEFGDVLADLVVFQAAFLGAAERGDNEKLAVSEKLFVNKLKLFTPEAA